MRIQKPQNLCYTIREVIAHLKDMKPADPSDPAAYPTVGENFIKETEFGTGTVNFEASVALLRKFGYDGYYGLEYAATSNDSAAIDEMIAFSRNLLA